MLFINHKHKLYYKNSNKKIQKSVFTVSAFLSLPVLVQLEHVEEDLAGQAALASASVRREQR